MLKSDYNFYCVFPASGGENAGLIQSKIPRFAGDFFNYNKGFRTNLSRLSIAIL